MRSTLFDTPRRSSEYAIRLLVPDLPPARELLPYLERIDANRWYTNFGPLVLEYETGLSEMTGAHVVTLSSATAALELAITALRLPAGSRALVPSFTFPASVAAIVRSGLTPILCDVDPETWTLTPEIAAAALERRDCRLVVPVATFGVPLPVAAWDAFARTAGVSVLMDAAAALGCQSVGQRFHTVYSVDATKPLGIGEGGVFAGHDEDLVERVRRLSNHGLENGAVAHSGATNAKMTEYAAAIGLAQLSRAHAVFCKRLSIWQSYRDALAHCDVTLQHGFSETAPALLGVNVQRRDDVVAALCTSGIETRCWYQPPVDRHPAFAALERLQPTGGLPVTEYLASHNLGLPFHAHLSHANVQRVASVIAAALARP